MKTKCSLNSSNSIRIISRQLLSKIEYNRYKIICANIILINSLTTTAKKQINYSAYTALIIFVTPDQTWSLKT